MSELPGFYESGAGPCLGDCVAFLPGNIGILFIVNNHGGNGLLGNIVHHGDFRPDIPAKAFFYQPFHRTDAFVVYVQGTGKFVNESVGTCRWTQAYDPFCGDTLFHCQRKTGTAERMCDDCAEGAVALVEFGNDISYLIDSGLPAGAFPVRGCVESQYAEAGFQ